MADFPSTKWSLILRCGQSPSLRHSAFASLALRYRGAICAYFRARLDRDAAEDATQSFLAQSFEHAWWARAEPHSGSFRCFLFMLMRRHLGHLRGSAQRCASVSAIDIEALADETADPQRQFDARFALLLTARAVTSLRARYAGRGRGLFFEQLLPLLSAPPDHGRIREVATQLCMVPNTLTIEIKRLRVRLRDALRAELSELCAESAALESEWASLLEVIGGATRKV